MKRSHKAKLRCSGKERWKLAVMNIPALQTLSAARRRRRAILMRKHLICGVIKMLINSRSSRQSGDWPNDSLSRASFAPALVLLLGVVFFVVNNADASARISVAIAPALATPGLLAHEIAEPILQRKWFIMGFALLACWEIIVLERNRAAQMKELNAALSESEDALIRSNEERLLELQQVRRRIATDLHDDVGSSLTKIALLSEAARQKIACKDEVACEHLISVTAISNELVETMSDIVWAINPQKDNLSDLSQRMRRFASDIFTARQINFRFQTPAIERDIRLGANVRREVLLIFKESVNNAVKHSQCSEVILNFSVEAGWLELSISDNGKGFDPALVKADTGFLTSARKGGNGLASMRRRAREMGGQLEITTSEDSGTTLSLRLPLENLPPGDE